MNTGCWKCKTWRDNKRGDKKTRLWSMNSSIACNCWVNNVSYLAFISLVRYNKQETMQACTEARVATSVCPTHFSPRSAFPHLNCTLKSLSKAFFVHCMTHGCPLFPCYNCYWLGDEQIGAEAHEQAPQLFPRTVEILPRVFSPKLILHFPHKVCCQGLWWGKQGEGKNISCSWTYIF